MKKIECASLLLLFLAAANGCSCNNPLHEIPANAPPPNPVATITKPSRFGDGPPEIHSFMVRPNENKSLQDALTKAGPSGHIDVDVSNGQLVSTPDWNPSHITPSMATIKTAASRPVPVFATSAAQRLMEEREVH
jgi:hypothetical protein